MVEEILENPQLHLWWFMVRWSSWRRMNFWPWNIKLCCWYSVWLVLCDVWRWSSTEIIELSRNLWVCRYLYIKTSLAIIICLEKADFKSLRREAFSCHLGWHRLSAWKKQITKALEERLLVAIWGDTDCLLESRFYRPLKKGLSVVIWGNNQIVYRLKWFIWSSELFYIAVNNNYFAFSDLLQVIRSIWQKLSILQNY